MCFAEKNVPREEMLEVAENYQHFGGVSPINGQCRLLIEALRKELDAHSIKLPIYWGNRNWKPLLDDTCVRWEPTDTNARLHSLRRCLVAIAVVGSIVKTSSRLANGSRATAPEVDMLRMAYNHPGFIEPQAELLGSCSSRFP